MVKMDLENLFISLTRNLVAQFNTEYFARTNIGFPINVLYIKFLFFSAYEKIFLHLFILRELKTSTLISQTENCSSYFSKPAYLARASYVPYIGEIKKMFYFQCFVIAFRFSGLHYLWPCDHFYFLSLHGVRRRLPSIFSFRKCPRKKLRRVTS